MVPKYFLNLKVLLCQLMPAFYITQLCLSTHSNVSSSLLDWNCLTQKNLKR